MPTVLADCHHFGGLWVTILDFWVEFFCKGLPAGFLRVAENGLHKILSLVATTWVHWHRSLVSFAPLSTTHVGHFGPFPCMGLGSPRVAKTPTARLKTSCSPTECIVCRQFLPCCTWGSKEQNCVSGFSYGFSACCYPNIGYFFLACLIFWVHMKCWSSRNPRCAKNQHRLHML
jgi:hypothetical protein